MHDNAQHVQHAAPPGCCPSPVDPDARAFAGAWRDAPLGCTGSSDEVRGIVRLLAELAANSVAEPRRTASGYALRLARSPRLEQLAGEFVSRDKACCPFLEFELGRDGEELWLDVTGPGGATMVLDLSFELCRVAAEPRTRA